MIFKIALEIGETLTVAEFVSGKPIDFKRCTVSSFPAFECFEIFLPGEKFTHGMKFWVLNALFRFTLT